MFTQEDDATGAKVVKSIFTDRVVGIMFAVAFGLWAWYLNHIADTVLAGVDDLRDDNAVLVREIRGLEHEIQRHRLDVAQQLVMIVERQAAITRRLDAVERDNVETRRLRKAE